ncbi:phage major capsid protein [Hyphomonas sp.]|uniref:phage major capsid protein n=1 Tax=Hyphomonas sp. TaxID=87 RepID=UPI0025C5781D|nr:phage major capsid protein [Hyphomonas sp.]MBI1401449.1 phage major capsid protein [Hyphomonas sp.]
MKPLHLLAGAAALANPALAYRERDDNGADPVVAAVAALKADILKNHGQMTEDLNKLKTDFGSNTSEHERFKADIDEKLSKNAENFNSLKAMLDDLAQKSARAGARPEKVKTLGQAITGHEDFKKFTGAKGDSVRFKVKAEAAVKAITGLDASAGALVEPTLAGVVGSPKRRLTVRGLLASARTNSDSVKFVRKTFTNNAAPQAGEGAAKAESNITFTPETAEVVTIAHFVRVSRQILGNVPALEAMLDVELRYGLAYKEETQLLLGSGATNNINGLVTAATAFARPAGVGQMTGVTPIDVLRVAALQGTVAEYFVDGFVINPVNWALIELVKDTTGRHIIGNPNGEGDPRLWATPVVPTNAMPAGNFLAGSFAQAAQIFDREDADVMMSGEDADNFTKNLVTILCESQLTQAIYAPQALITGTFTAATAALQAA